MKAVIKYKDGRELGPYETFNEAKEILEEMKRQNELSLKRLAVQIAELDAAEVAEWRGRVK